jgi:hypothetical protein
MFSVAHEILYNFGHVQNFARTDTFRCNVDRKINRATRMSDYMIQTRARLELSVAKLLSAFFYL